MSADVKTIVKTTLRRPTSCRHCGKTAELEYVQGDSLIGVHVCPDRYVSRIIEYGTKVDLGDFKDYIQQSVDGLGDVEDSDVRIAKRYAWDLGLDMRENDLILMEAYWTQNYRRTKNDDPNRKAFFFCANRDNFFVQPLTSKEKLCEKCRAKKI